MHVTDTATPLGKSGRAKPAMRGAFAAALLSMGAVMGCTDADLPAGTFACYEDDDCLEDRRCAVFEDGVRTCGDVDPTCPASLCAEGVRDLTLGCGLASLSDGSACTAGGCMTGVCDAGACVDQVLAAGACDDGNACTVDDTCTDGVCAGSDLRCDVCQVCDPAAGACGADLAQNGDACDDADVCTVQTMCDAGQCGLGKPGTWAHEIGGGMFTVAGWSAYRPIALLGRPDGVVSMGQGVPLFTTTPAQPQAHFAMRYDVWGAGVELERVTAAHAFHSATVLGDETIAVGAGGPGVGSVIGRLSDAGAVVWLHETSGFSHYQAVCASDAEIWAVGNVWTADAIELPWIWQIDPETGEAVDSFSFVGEFPEGRFNACRASNEAVTLGGYAWQGGQKAAVMARFDRPAEEIDFVRFSEAGYHSSEILELGPPQDIGTVLVAVDDRRDFLGVGWGRSDETAAETVLLTRRTWAGVVLDERLIGSLTEPARGHAVLDENRATTVVTTRFDPTLGAQRVWLEQYAEDDFDLNWSEQIPGSVAVSPEGASVFALRRAGYYLSFERDPTTGVHANAVMKLDRTGKQLCPD